MGTKVTPMADVTIEADAFGRTLSQLLGRVSTGVSSRTPEAIDKALAVGEDEWKKNAKAVLSVSYSRGGWGKIRGGEKGVTRYKSGKRKGQIKAINWYGKVYKTGRYARSIRHHMLQGGEEPAGETGSPTMPGLAHLLEKGHASIGGGAVPAYEHIAPAADKAFDDFEGLLDRAVEEAINDA